MIKSELNKAIKILQNMGFIGYGYSEHFNKKYKLEYELIIFYGGRYDKLADFETAVKNGEL